MRLNNVLSPSWRPLLPQLLLLATVCCGHLAYAYPPTEAYTTALDDNEAPATLPVSSSSYNNDNGDDLDDNGGGYAATLMLPSSNNYPALSDDNNTNKSNMDGPVGEPASSDMPQDAKQTPPAATYQDAYSSGGPQPSIADMSTSNNNYNQVPATATTGASGMQPAYVYKADLPTMPAVSPLPGQNGALRPEQDDDDASDTEYDSESSKKIIGSSVVTSVSVILNDGNEPQFADAAGQRVPKPQPSLQVASPINLLNPDRYEFYTFDERGELVKRLMTMQEIQSIVANGDGEGPSIIHMAPVMDRDPEKNVQDIVESVQSVLNKEVESAKNSTAETLPVLDTPDVSSSWSMILPAIFGNNGGEIYLQQKPQQIVMTPESDLLETTTKIPATTTTKKQKPNKRKPGQKRKPTPSTSTTHMTPQQVQEELAPNESVYTGMQQYQNIASNMQSFEGFAQMHMEPIYHKFPASSTPSVEATTKRVVVNNQATVQFDMNQTTEKAQLSEEFAKKPIGAHHKPLAHPKRPQPPHRQKKPNGGHQPAESSSSTTTTQSHAQRPHNKQKVTKKPLTTTTPVATTAVPTTPSTTTTTTTTTTAASETTTSPAPSTSTAAPTVSTTRKKKKPTRKPSGGHTTPSSEQATGHAKPHPAGDKRKPHPSPAAHQRPKPSSTQKPEQQSDHLHNSYHGMDDDQTAESTIHKHQHKYQHKKRPRPRPTTTTTTTMTTTPEPTEITESSLIVQEFPGYEDSQKMPSSSIIKEDTKQSTPLTGYPVPSYGVSQIAPEYETDVEELDISKLKKKPLPSLSMIQQQHAKPQQSPTQPQQVYGMETQKPESIVTAEAQAQEDANTMNSYEQILQSLKEEINGAAQKRKEAEKGDTKTQVTSQPKYESTSSAPSTTQKEVEKKTTASIPILATTIAPNVQAQYGGSTLATILADEDGMTGRPISMDLTTDTASIEDMETTVIEEEHNTPVVIITARPHFYATTKKPDESTASSPDGNEDASMKTDIPAYVVPLATTEETLTSSTPRPTEKTTQEQANVVKYEPLYADVQDPIISDVTILGTTTTPTATYSNFNEDENTTMQMSIEVETHTETHTTIADNDDEPGYTMQQELARLPVKVPQRVDSIIAEGGETTQPPPMVADLKPSLNMDIIKPNDQISMSDFQTQAATVASTLVDGTNTMGADVFMSSNETKSEIEFLMSDVIQQITNQNAYHPTSHSDDKNDSHRLTNFAQLNSSFLLKPMKTEPQAQYVTSTSSIQATTAATKPTVMIPSKEELIKKEAEYLNAMHSISSTTEVPEVDETESTTFKVTIPSLSQIYMEQLENAEKTQTGDTSEKEHTTMAPTEQSAEEENAATESYATESFENNKETTYIEKDSTEATPISDKSTDDESSSSDNETQEQKYAIMINASDSEIEKTTAENQESKEDISTEDAMSETAKEEESTEQGYATSINAVQTTTTKDTVLKPTKENDDITTVEQPRPQYDSETQIDESDHKLTTVPDELEYTTKRPGDESTIYITDSDMELSSEQTTDKYTTFPQSSETDDKEQSEEELTAEISEEEEVEESVDAEDPYVKLGEHHAKPISITEEQSPLGTTSASSQTQQLQGEATTNIPTKTEIILNNHQVMMPVMSYGADTDADEEDEDDQTGYQVPQITVTQTTSPTTKGTTSTSTTTTSTTPKPTKRLNTLKPVSYFKQPLKAQAELPKPINYTANTPSQKPMQRPPNLSNLMASSTQATRPPVKLEPSPDNSKGLEASTRNLDEDILTFARLCNELAFSYWKSITSEKISSARSLVISPFALTSMLSMVFLGARGGTSGEMNDVLKLDDMVTFNPHLVFKNITESVEHSEDSDIATSAFVREIFSDRSNGKILQFFKEKTQQFYAGHVEEVNFHVVNDIIRRRTNLLVKRHTMGKVLEYLRTNSVWVNGPLATISANLFQTDCSQGSTTERDGEMFFQVHPSVRQRRLVPIPAVLYKSGFSAGYEPKLDATVVAFGRIQDTVSIVYVMPGHQSSVSPTDNLDRLENDLIEMAFSGNAWSNILTSVMDRPGMEVQLPRFSHRSFVNASLGLQKMGLKGLFKSDFADLRGLTGSSNRDIYISDMIQINTFSTCGEERISDHHHVEMYPAPPLRKRNKDVDAREDDEFDSSEAVVDFGSLVQESTLGRGFYDDLLDPKYLELPLPLRPRQARVPDTPRLRFDKPFLYFVRHNPTGMILFMGRFNPRLLP